MPILLSTFYFFYFSIVGVYLIFLPKVLSGVGYSASEIGILFSAGPLVRFILPFLFMKGLELNRQIFNIALLILVLSATAFYFSIYDFYQLLFSNIMLGVGMSLILPYVEVISLQTIGKESYGKVRLFGSVGFILVALVLVKLLSSPYTALYFLLTLSFITALIAFVIARQVHKKKSLTQEKISNDINLLKDWKLWSGLVLMQMSFGAFYNFFTIYVTNHGIDMDMTIYLWSFGVCIEILMLYFQGNFLKGNLLFLLQLTTLVTALRWFIVYLAPDNLSALFFSQSIHALSFALFHSTAISYLYNLYRHKSLAQQFFSGITYGLGGLSGALISGYIYEWYPEYLFLSSAFMAFGAFVFVSLWSRERSV
jgi:PPP family 3-phenylpropionic acid transporter